MENRIKFNANMALARTKVAHERNEELVKEFGECMEYVFKTIKNASCKDTSVEIKFTSISDYFFNMIITRLEDLGFYAQKRNTRTSEEAYDDRFLKVCWDRANTILKLKIQLEDNTDMYFTYDMSNGDIEIKNARVNGKVLGIMGKKENVIDRFVDYYIVDTSIPKMISNKNKAISVTQDSDKHNEAISRLLNKLSNRTININCDDIYYSDLISVIEDNLDRVKSGKAKYVGCNKFIEMLILMSAGVKEITELIGNEYRC